MPCLRYDIWLGLFDGVVLGVLAEGVRYGCINVAGGLGVDGVGVQRLLIIILQLDRLLRLEIHLVAQSRLAELLLLLLFPRGRELAKRSIVRILPVQYEHIAAWPVVIVSFLASASKIVVFDADSAESLSFTAVVAHCVLDLVAATFIHKSP